MTERIEAKFAAEAGVKYANAGQWELAVLRFTEAIALYPMDFRFFLNRAFCYFYLHHYDMSLADADQAIALSQGLFNAKPYYRRAMALLGLDRVPEALVAFENVLRIDNTCPVSEEKRRQIRAVLLMDAGFSESDAEKLAEGHEPLADLINKRMDEGEKQAVTSADHLHNRLVDETVRHMLTLDPIPDYESDADTQTAGRPLSEPEPVSLNRSTGDAADPIPQSEPILCDSVSESVLSHSSSLPSHVWEQVKSSLPELLDLEPVTNPIGFHAVTVSNVAVDATRPALMELFSQFGSVDSVYRLRAVVNAEISPPGAVTILVQYADPDSPAKAVMQLRDEIFWDGITANRMKPLMFKLTTSQIQKTAKFLTIDMAAELCELDGQCFKWRGPAGCQNENCDKAHTRANHRLDSHSYFYWLNEQDNSF